MSRSYPVEVETVTLNHRGGTKSYHLTRLSNNAGKSLVIYRWGKTGSFGEVKIEQFESTAQADKAFSKKLDAKMKGGYEIDASVDPKPKECEDFSDIRKRLGRPLTSKLGASNINHLDPDMDTSKIREAEAPRLDEEGRINRETEAEKARRLEEEKRKAREEAKAREQQEFQQVYGDNPNFGAF